MSRITRMGLLLPVAVALLTLAPLAARAQTPEPRPPSNATLAGEVTDVNPLKVKVNGEERLLQTSPTVTVVRDGKEVKLGDLEKGDKVTFTTNPDNTVQRMDVTETAGADMSKWLLIGLIVLAALVIAGLVWYMTQRRNRDRVVYRTDPDTTVTSHR